MKARALISPAVCKSMLVRRTSEAADRTPHPSERVHPFRRKRMKRLRIGEDVFMRLLPRQARQGSTRFGRMGDVVQQRPVWVGLSGLLAFAGGPRGQRAAARGSVCFAVAAIVANLVVKPLAGRRRPPGSARGRTGPVTSSFPSGHAATDLAFTLGVARALLPLGDQVGALRWISGNWYLVIPASALLVAAVAGLIGGLIGALLAAVYNRSPRHATVVVEIPDVVAEEPTAAADADATPRPRRAGTRRGRGAGRGGSPTAPPSGDR